MQKTKLRPVVLVHDTQYSVGLPPNTYRMVLSSPSNLPIRCSLVDGDVLKDEEGWVIDRNNTAVVELNSVDGPLYFASAEPGGILDIEVDHE